MAPNVAIIMCTYNGDKFLQEQLKSFQNQIFSNWNLFVFDDGSKDDTLKLISNFAQEPKVKLVVNNTKMGFAKNFHNGIASTPGNFDFYALSDQDDIWCEAKLEKAVSYLQNIDSGIPALYCSRTTLADSTARNIGLSPKFSKKPSFSNALVQSIAGGNTMVFNKAAKNLISKVGAVINTPSHDWFIYQLVSGAGGFIYYDPNSEILYRQHESNIIGSNIGYCARLQRAKMLLDNQFRGWNDRNIKILQDNSYLLTHENKNILDVFAMARKSSMVRRPYGFLKCGIYRQTFLGNIGLIIGGILNKI